ncbi:MAG: class I SAM-dependent methyltransferase [Bacteroidetes bacterium]|nr:class I SAM-dependent methyltransferase [Bacteroidota bacterium]
MAHVDYVMWAEYVFELLQQHHPAANDILELGCGTGSLALVLQPLGGYSYHASDFSQEMLAVARRKTRQARIPISFEQMDFRAVPPKPQYDAILLLYDGINYITEPTEIAAVLEGAYRALRPGGVFIFDHSTPANSLLHSDGFDDAGQGGAFRFLRTSRYDADTQLHTTLFRLGVDGKTHTERHVQRAYTQDEIRALIGASAFSLEAGYDGFTFEPAGEDSERIHHVLRRPEEAVELHALPQAG